MALQEKAPWQFSQRTQVWFPSIHTGSSQPSVPPVPGDRTPSSGLPGHHAHTQLWRHVCIQNTRIHRINKYILKLKNSLLSAWHTFWLHDSLLICRIAFLRSKVAVSFCSLPCYSYLLHWVTVSLIEIFLSWLRPFLSLPLVFCSLP